MIVLKPMKTATKIFESEKVPTMSCVIPMVLWVLNELSTLRTTHPSGSVTCCTLITSIKSRIIDPITSHDEVWQSVFFDPRTKRSLIDTEYHDRVVTESNLSFNKMFPPPLPIDPQSPTPVMEEKKKKSALEIILPTPKITEVKEFDRYLATPQIASDDPAPGKWLLAQGYHKIFALYQKFCSIPGAATKIERLWSDTGNLVTKKRSCLDPNFVVQRVLYRNNLDFYEQ